MRARGEGAIINLSSVAARTGGTSGTMFYAAAKAYVASITRSMAREYAADRIRVNAVAPGVLSTPPLDRYAPPALVRQQIGSASVRDRVCQSVEISVVAVPLKKKNETTYIKALPHPKNTI